MPDPSQLAEMYRRMLRIRFFEEGIREVYARALMPGNAHLYIGEEAVAVGTCMAISEKDFITSTHRGHGHLIAKGGRVDRMMAEVLGKRVGYNQGKGGTMHIADFSLGILGANGIVGGGFGIAAGAALSAKLQKSGAITVCFFGDGAVNQGVFFETLNLAAIWQLPVVYICENNQYGEFTAYQQVTAGESIGLRPAAFGIPHSRVDGQDVLAVYQVARMAVERARSGEGPSFVEAVTYRYFGHHLGDPGKSYRSEDEIARWKARDPIFLFQCHLTQHADFDKDILKTIEDEISQEIEIAIDFARAAPFPDPSEVFEHVYA